MRRKIEGILFDWLIAKEPVSNIVITGKIIEALREEIEKVENPYGGTEEGEGWDDCKGKILEIMSPKPSTSND